MKKTNIGTFSSVPLGYVDKSEDSPPLRPFAAWQTYGGVSLYLNEETLRVNGENIMPVVNGQSSGTYGGILSAGDWWCFIYKLAHDEEADPLNIYDAVIAKKEWATGYNNIIYCFRVIEVFDDLTFQQYAYGGVDITGLPTDTSRQAPFHISVLGYRDDCKSEVHYKLYAPREPEGVCASYNGEPCAVKFFGSSSEEQGDYFEIEVDDKGAASVYGVITSPNPDAATPKYYLEITQQETNVVYERVDSFCIAEIGPRGDTPPDPKDEAGNEGEGLSAGKPVGDLALSGSALPLTANDDQSGDSEEIKYRTLLRPFGITSFESSARPSWSGRVMMYIPKDSLYLNSEIIEITKNEQGQGDLVLLSPGTWWCVITGDPDEDATETTAGTFQAYSDTDVQAMKMHAELVMSDDYPAEKNLFYAFKVAEVYSEMFEDGAFQEFAYGQVQLGMDMPGVHHIVPFQVMTVNWISQEAVQKREYYCYVPQGKSLFSNGVSVTIEGTEGSWVKLPVKNEDQFFGVTVWCYRLAKQDSEEEDENDPAENLSRNAMLTTDKKEFATQKLEFYFPIARIGPGYEDGLVTSRVLIVGVENPQEGRALRGARLDAARMSNLFSEYVKDGIVLVDDEASVENVKMGMQWVSKASGAAVIYFSCHGSCDGNGNNTLGLYDGSLTDAEVWEVVESAACPVFLIFDACMSGTMYAPPGEGGTVVPFSTVRPKDWATAMEKRALGSGNANVQMLCWAAAADDQFAWGNHESGGALTSAIAQFASKGKFYWEIWTQIFINLTHRQPPCAQIPVKTEIGDFWQNRRFFIEEDATT